MGKTTILIEKKTRDALVELGNKKQTYDQIIKNLIQQNKNSENYHNLST
ncbi:conserved protein of unknown function [Candidatus Nitrosocosmicus franklandus]|uniref:Uncharacterized protein n=1 Tax=Candidatus Nitrosocosmicus franklandianus TaxID=1798806 RepID=A0A484IFV5_9ARCH|nr:conserved protein of unknown function [Candidatus Nitrosocosmicus franklandus]